MFALADYENEDQETFQSVHDAPGGISYRHEAGAEVAYELSDEDVAREEAFLSGIPRFNLGAFLLPGIWGPGHGLWVCILFYPLWLLADNVFYGAYVERSFLALVLAAIVFVALALVHVVFGVLSQPYAWHKAAEKGVSKDTYLKRERIWAIAMIVLGIAALAVATYYNLQIRPTLEY